MKEYFIVRKDERLVEALKEHNHGYDSLESAKRAALIGFGVTGWTIVEVSDLEVRPVLGA